MRLEAFQRKFIVEVYDNPAGTSQGILSIARKNGKSALIAALVLVHLVGPEARQNSQIVSGARSRKQASIVFNLAAKMASLDDTLRKIIKPIPSLKTLIGLTMNTTYEALAAEAGTAHGLSPALAILDELGQVRGDTDPFVEAIETAQGAYDDALTLVISTQAATDADMLSVRIDDALNSGDPKIVCHLYVADDDCDLDDPEQWERANPAMGVFRSRIELETQATKAKRMASFESSFRNLYLNQRVNVNSPFVARSVWDACGGRLADWGTAPVYAGLDLSSTSDLTAFVAVAMVGGHWHVRPTFWLPSEGLAEKARADRTPWHRWAREGWLQTTPGRSVEYEYVAAWLRRFVDNHNVRKIGFDRWGMKHLTPWLIKAGFDDAEIEQLFEGFGQGFGSMSPALRDLESALLEKKMVLGEFDPGDGVLRAGHPVLNACAANAVVTLDPAGNRKLNKAKATGRIDGLVALAMATGIATSDYEPVAPKSFWEAA